MSADLSTKYLGLELKSPLVVSACPLTQKLDALKEMEASGASAAVLPSLFEEQIQHEEVEMTKAREFGTDSFAEALTYFPEQEDYRSGPDAYLEHIAAAKKAVSIPIIASLNGTSEGGWVRYAKLMQEAGADALELNIYFVATGLDLSGPDVEKQYLDLVAAVKQSVSIPLAVKVGPYFSSMGNMARTAGRSGCRRPGTVQPVPPARHRPGDAGAVSQGRAEHALRVAQAAPLDRNPPRAACRFVGATSGIHQTPDLAKALLAGADVGMVTSVLYKEGIGHIRTILDGLSAWMDEKSTIRSSSSKAA